MALKPTDYPRVNAPKKVRRSEVLDKVHKYGTSALVAAWLSWLQTLQDDISEFLDAGEEIDWEAIEDRHVDYMEHNRLLLLAYAATRIHGIYNYPKPIDIEDTDLVEWTRSHTREFAHKFTDTARNRLSAVLALVEVLGWGSDTLEARAEQHVALNARQSDSLISYEKALRKKGKSESIINRSVSQQAKKKARYRAEMIGDYETSLLSTRVYMEYADKNGVVEVIYAAMPTACGECTPWNGVRMSLSEFSVLVPAHVNCRCQPIFVNP